VQILTLCTANQCRSPMAEVLLQRALDQRGVLATVASAGSMRGGVPVSDGSVRAEGAALCAAFPPYR
jgi:protein-tyrosine-phosphatase